VDHGCQLTLGHGYSRHVCLLQPDSRGRVQLADRKPHSAPLIDPQFLTGGLWVQSLVLCCSLQRRASEKH